MALGVAMAWKCWLAAPSRTSLNFPSQENPTERTHSRAGRFRIAKSTVDNTDQ